MAIKIPHVVNRDGVFYYVRRVPKAVLDRPGARERFFNGQDTVRSSLFTSNLTKAAELAAHASREFEARVQQALDEGAEGLPRKLAPVTEQGLRLISTERKRAIANHFRQLVLMREMGGEAADYAEDMIYQMEMDAESIKRAVQGTGGEGDPHYDIRAQAREMIRDEGLNAPDGSTDFARIVSVLRQAEFQSLTEGFDVVYGRKSILDLQPAQATLAPVVPQTASIMLSDVVEKYIARQQNKRTINGIREALRSFVAACGDLPLAELRAAHFRQFCRAEASQDVGGRTKGSVSRPRSAATIDKKMVFLRAAINQAMNDFDFAGPNPAVGVSAKYFARPLPRASMPAKRAFNLSELNLVLQHPWFVGCRSATSRHEPGDHRLTGMWYWGPIVALLTGCRAGEIGGLALDEVMIDHPCPHLIIRNNKFRTTKSGTQRLVPVIDQRMELGFAEYVEAQRKAGATRLFDDWEAPTGFHDASAKPWSNGMMVRAFNTTLIPKALKSLLTEGARREVTFHSFRGAFKTLITRQKYHLQPNYANEVIGHSKTKNDKAYVGVITLEETYEAIRGCRYEGLVIPPPPPVK